MYDKSEFDDNEFPIAYFTTFRTYGTWLHGDQRTSIRRNRRTKTDRKLIQPNVPFEEAMREEMGQDKFVLDRNQRREVEAAIRELCKERGYTLYAINVRSNHVHIVVGVAAKPERIADAFKAIATKRLRKMNLVTTDRIIWSRGRSRKYLWKPNQVSAAIDYVLCCQSDMPFELDD